jgi:hypothetical protein
MTGARPVEGRGPTTNTGDAPRPTTLSGAAAQLDAAGTPKKSRMPVFAGAAVAVVAVVVAVVAMSGKKETPRPAPAPVAAVPAPVKAVDDELVVTVTSDPSSAKVYRGGAEIGTTPFDIKFKKGAPEFEIQVKKEGFVAAVRPIQTDRSKEILVPLTKEAAPGAAVPVAAGKKSSHHGSDSHKKTKAAGGGDDMQLLSPSF